jgi:hypothetical protein
MSNKHPKHPNMRRPPNDYIDNQLEALNEFDSLYDPMFSLEEMFDRIFPYNNREGKEHAQ